MEGTPSGVLTLGIGPTGLLARVSAAYVNTQGVKIFNLKKIKKNQTQQNCKSPSEFPFQAPATTTTVTKKRQLFLLPQEKKCSCFLWGLTVEKPLSYSLWLHHLSQFSSVP